MKKLKSLLISGAILGSLFITSISVFAASNYNNIAEVAAGVTGRTIESVVNERNETGKSFGTIAYEAGKLDEFQKESLELKKDILDSRVANGLLTQAEADQIIKSIEDNQLICGGAGLGCGGGYGLGCGGRTSGNGYGHRSEEHTSALHPPFFPLCRLLLSKKKIIYNLIPSTAYILPPSANLCT